MKTRGDGKNSLAAKGKEKKTDVWQEYLAVIGPLMNEFTEEPVLWHILRPYKRQH